MAQFNYGGQAVIEGVMIRGQKAAAVAVRKPNGQVHSICEPLGSLYTGKLRRAPFVRGVVVLIETMTLGMRALIYSANVAMEEEDQPQTGLPKGSIALWIMVAISLLLSVGLFFMAPLALARLFAVETSPAFAAIEGVIRILLFVLYLGAISFMPDIRRVFAYHGAEHMTIAAYEHGSAILVQEIRRFPKEHPRCGTAFLITVMLFAVLVFSLFGIVHPPLWMTVLSRIIFIPLIASGSYEIIRFNAAHENTILGRTAMAPGIWLQHLTTRNPDDAQIEVAVTAMEAALAADAVPPFREWPQTVA